MSKSLRVITRIIAIAFLFTAAIQLSMRYSLIPFERHAERAKHRVDTSALKEEEKKELREVIEGLRSIHDSELDIMSTRYASLLALGGLLSALVAAGILSRSEPNKAPEPTR